METLEEDDSLPRWLFIVLTGAITLPWAILPICDAIDFKYRTIQAIACCLAISTLLLTVSYGAALYFIIHEGIVAGDESIAILVLIIFNLWYVLRNIRGWLQLVALRRLKPAFALMHRNIFSSFPRELEGHSTPPIRAVLVSERLVDNDCMSDTPFLQPFPKLYGNPRVDSNLSGYSEERKYQIQTVEIFAVAIWKAWWTQDISILQGQHDLSANSRLTHGISFYPNTENLDASQGGPRYPSGFLAQAEEEGLVAREKWRELLASYSTESNRVVGQQDTHQDPTIDMIDYDFSHIVALVVEEKSIRKPNRISVLWHNTARFEKVYEDNRKALTQEEETPSVVLPTWSSWVQIAQDISTNLCRPVYLNGSLLTNFAAELSAASVILLRYPEKYKRLIKQIHMDGLNARWTYGWSGLLSCFSALWTTERIYFAMLNGLSLLAISGNGEVANIDKNVRAMLYGYASFAVSDRAIGEKIKDLQQKEMSRRHVANRGVTFRGYGLDTVRRACKRLGIPRDVRFMDGPLALSVAWAMKYLDGECGLDTLTQGSTHEEIDRLLGSSTAWRYPARYD